MWCRNWEEGLAGVWQPTGRGGQKNPQNLHDVFNRCGLQGLICTGAQLRYFFASCNCFNIGGYEPKLIKVALQSFAEQRLRNTEV